MNTTPGIATVPSPFSVEDTASKLKALIEAKGLTLFAEIDYAAGAQAAGLHMPPARVLIFGHAKAGTPLMLASPLLALDLPLKALIWEDAEQKVQVSYNTPEYLANRHNIPPDLLKNISGVGNLVSAALT